MNTDARAQKKTATSSDKSAKDAMADVTSKKTAKSKVDSKKAVEGQSIDSRRVWPD